MTRKEELEILINKLREKLVHMVNVDKVDSISLYISDSFDQMKPLLEQIDNYIKEYKSLI